MGRDADLPGYERGCPAALDAARAAHHHARRGSRTSLKGGARTEFERNFAERARLGYAYVMDKLDFYLVNDAREKASRDAVCRAIA